MIYCIPWTHNRPCFITFLLLCSKLQHRCKMHPGSSSQQQASWSPGFPSSVPRPSRVRKPMPQNFSNILRLGWMVMKADPVTSLGATQNVSGMADFLHMPWPKWHATKAKHSNFIFVLHASCMKSAAK